MNNIQIKDLLQEKAATSSCDEPTIKQVVEEIENNFVKPLNNECIICNN